MCLSCLFEVVVGVVLVFLMLVHPSRSCIATEHWIDFVKMSPESPCVHADPRQQEQNKAMAVYASSRVILLARPQSFTDFVDQHVVGITQHEKCIGILAGIGKNPGVVANVHMLLNVIISKSSVFPLSADEWFQLASKLLDRVIQAWDGKFKPAVRLLANLVCIVKLCGSLLN